MPSNMTDEIRVLARLDGRMANAPLSAALGSLALESALPVRAFFSWPGKRNYEGMWWSSTVRSHVGFESLLERDFLLLADHDRDVVGVSSQPFAFLSPRGTEGAPVIRTGTGLGELFVSPLPKLPLFFAPSKSPRPPPQRKCSYFPTLMEVTDCPARTPAVLTATGTGLSVEPPVPSLPNEFNPSNKRPRQRSRMRAYPCPHLRQ
jgi:hypothetical protein